MGVNIEELSKHPGDEHKCKQGIYVTEVIPISYASIVGLKKGDVIQSIDDFEMNSPQDLLDFMETTNPYDTVHVKLMRGKKKKEMDIELF